MIFDRDFRRGLEQSCRVCRGDAGKRAEWGCVVPTAKPWEHIDCFVCDDRPADLAAGATKCVACDGTRKLPLHRCPWSMIGPREQFVCEVATMVEAGHSPWPDAGWAEWPATFCDALQLVLHELSVLRARAAKRASEG